MNIHVIEKKPTSGRLRVHHESEGPVVGFLNAMGWMIGGWLGGGGGVVGEVCWFI